MADQAEFEAAAGKAKGLPKQSNETLLELYGLYKQATEGDVAGDRPGMFDFVAGAKYESWEKRRGMSKQQAMDDYVELVNKLAAE